MIGESRFLASNPGKSRSGGRCGSGPRGSNCACQASSTRWGARNRQAIDSKLAHTGFLALLIEDEVARRKQKFTCRRRRAAFRSNKTLGRFDFDRLPEVDPILGTPDPYGRRSLTFPREAGPF